MRSFKDNNGKEWSVDIDTSVVSRLRSELKIDLMSVFSSDLLTRLMDDIVLAAEVLYWVVRPQAVRDNVTDEMWAKAIKGKYAEVHRVLAEEIADFFESQGLKSMIVRNGLRTLKMVEEKTAARAETWFAENGIEEKIEEAIQKVFGGLSTSVQDALGSTRPDSNSGS